MFLETESSSLAASSAAALAGVGFFMQTSMHNAGVNVKVKVRVFFKIHAGAMQINYEEHEGHEGARMS